MFFLIWVQYFCDPGRHWRWSVPLGCSPPWSPLSRSSLAGECGLSWSSFLSFLVIPNLIVGEWVRFEFLSFLVIPNLIVGEWVPANNYTHLIGKVHGNCSLLRRLKWLFNIAIDVREELDWANFLWNSVFFQWFHWCLLSTWLCLYWNLWIPNPKLTIVKKIPLLFLGTWSLLEEAIN